MRSNLSGFVVHSYKTESWHQQASVAAYMRCCYSGTFDTLTKTTSVSWEFFYWVVSSSYRFYNYTFLTDFVRYKEKMAYRQLIDKKNGV